MDQDTIQTIAQEVAQRLPGYALQTSSQISWQLITLQAVLIILAFVAGILFAERMRLRAVERRRDEAVAGELGEDDWRTREWANLRRTKLEVLLNRMHDCEHFADATDTGARAQERDPLAELEVITTLYFPELKAEVDGYLDQCRVRRSTASTAGGAAGNLVDFKSARDQLSTAAQTLTTRIMGLAA